MPKLLLICFLAVCSCFSVYHSSCEKIKGASSETSLVLKNWHIEKWIFALSWLCMADLYQLLSCYVHYATDLTFIRRWY